MRNNYQLVIYYENDILVGVIYDNEGSFVCKSNNISFWFRRFRNILNIIKDSKVLYINFNPTLKRYQSFIIKNSHGFYNEGENEVLKKVEESSLPSCLDKLNQNIGLEFIRIINKKKNYRYLKK